MTLEKFKILTKKTLKSRNWWIYCGVTTLLVILLGTGYAIDALLGGYGLTTIYENIFSSLHLHLQSNGLVWAVGGVIAAIVSEALLLITGFVAFFSKRYFDDKALFAYRKVPIKDPGKTEHTIETSKKIDIKDEHEQPQESNEVLNDIAEDKSELQLESNKTLKEVDKHEVTPGMNIINRILGLAKEDKPQINRVPEKPVPTKKVKTFKQSDVSEVYIPNVPNNKYGFYVLTLVPKLKEQIEKYQHEQSEKLLWQQSKERELEKLKKDGMEVNTSSCKLWVEHGWIRKKRWEQERVQRFGIGVYKRAFNEKTYEEFLINKGQHKGGKRGSYLLDLPEVILELILSYVLGDFNALLLSQIEHKSTLPISTLERCHPIFVREKESEWNVWRERLENRLVYFNEEKFVPFTMVCKKFNEVAYTYMFKSNGYFVGYIYNAVNKYILNFISFGKLGMYNIIDDIHIMIKKYMDNMQAKIDEMDIAIERFSNTDAGRQLIKEYQEKQQKSGKEKSTDAPSFPSATANNDSFDNGASDGMQNHKTLTFSGSSTPSTSGNSVKAPYSTQGLPKRLSLGT